ncbi:hypothetical protein [Dactylosporangium sp. NPDC048998]|uniref:hypothetical protein n=1 Tax=Dactylosporangium sp. NPDC048998 TaxID=3363976 RepID=UPI0037174FDB
MAWIASRPLWLRILIPIGLIVGVSALPFGLTYDLIGVERVTVQVESCSIDMHRPRPTRGCKGSWELADGRTVTGSISYIGRLEPGDRVEAWGNTKRATTNLTSSLLPLIPVAAVLLAAAAAIVVSLRLALRRRRAG